MSRIPWFRSVVLALAAILLWIAWRASENGRYVYHLNSNNLETVLDSRTGTMFFIAPGRDGEASLEIRLNTGEAVDHFIWRRAKTPSVDHQWGVIHSEPLPETDKAVK